MRQRMAELERQKSEFLQLASHELRGPITLVSGYLSMLEEGSLGELAGPGREGRATDGHANAAHE